MTGEAQIPHRLRIAQVVSYVSHDGAFGGPVAVAVSQSRALAALGYPVQLHAGWDGAGRLDVDGVDVRLHRGMRGRLPLVAIAPPSLPLTLRLRRRRIDVVHVHLGRDLVSLLALLALRGFDGTVVLQPHGMVMPDRRLIARIIDAVMVRPALQRADAVLALTDAEAAGIDEVGRGRSRVGRIRNGIEVASDAAVGRSGTPEVLFLARLHPRKNAPLFVQAALELIRSGVDAEFVVAGPDEGDLPEVRQLIAAAGSPDRIRYAGAVSPLATAARLRRASLYVLPSVGEVFPMTVLEALAVGTPVVITTDNGLAGELAEAGAALVVPPTVDGLVDAVLWMLTDEPARVAAAERGIDAARQRFSSTAVAERLVEIYRSPASAE